MLRDSSLRLFLLGILDREDLVDDTIAIFRELRDKHTASGETLLMASVYLAARKTGMSYTVEQVNRMFGSPSVLWVKYV